MICKNCGTNNSDSAKFCIYCASPLTTSSEPKKPQNRNFIVIVFFISVLRLFRLT